MKHIIPDENKLPFLSILLPCYNEEAILETNVRKIQDYLVEKASKYSWEILIINDGSKDKTGEIASNLSDKINTVRVIHHPTNLNLGKALQTGFCNANGEILVVLDIDLSYSAEHIGFWWIN
jgi:glycosyltransferase involved in cell wall biosynthesis